MNPDHLSLDQIVKINGVSPSALAKLHEVLDGPEVRSRYQLDHISSRSDIVYAKLPSVNRSDIVYAKLLGVKWNNEHQTYTVEIQLCMKQYLDLNATRRRENNYSVTIAKGNVLFAPSSVLIAIYHALGFYPEKEEVINPSQA